jgi:ATP-dependent Clp protease protease subunit
MQTPQLDDRLADRLTQQRIVMLGDEVTDELAARIVSHLLVLSHDDPEADIVLYVNSPGGSVLAGLAIYDVMQLIPNDVATVAAGLAASMGQVLLCAGAPGKRYALPNAQVLMHEGSAGLGGAAADVAIQAANLVATLDRMRSIVARHTGRPLDEIATDMGRDRWFDAEAARDYGFVDHIVTSLDEIAPRRVRPLGMAANGALTAGTGAVATGATGALEVSA